MIKTFNLPFGVTCKVSAGNHGEIKSELKKHISRKRADALESFLLALACEGVSIGDTRIVRALETCVESISNHE